MYRVTFFVDFGMTEASARLMLTNRGWLASQPSDFQHEVLSRSAFRIWQNGEVIYELGAPADGIYGLASGSLNLLIAPHRPGPFFVHVARPGFWVGEAAHISNTPRRAGLIARGRVTMFHLPSRGLADLCAFDRTAAWKIAAITVSHLDLTLSVVSNLMIRDPTRKVASFPLTLSSWNCAPSPPWDTMQMTQSELADICQLSRKTVVNAIGALQDAGAIRHSHKLIGIVDRRRLAELAAEL